MKYIDEFRNPAAVAALARRIRAAAAALPEIKLMEVCGTHTMSIARFGIRELLPGNVRLTSGPGCPVCVSPQSYVDKAIAYCRLPGAIVTTFGDMIRVPGSSSSLEREKAEGADVRVVLSAAEAVEIAAGNTRRSVVFLGIGFETTAPTVAAAVLEAAQRELSNFFVLSGHKTMPAAMRALASAPAIRIDGYICPPHVSAIIGSEVYGFLAGEFATACVVAGFEPLDILLGVLHLVEMFAAGQPRVVNDYARVVKPKGNPTAVGIMNTVFSPRDDEWRGIGVIPGSGLAPAREYADFDAEAALPVKAEPTRVPPGCICGSVLTGAAAPADCPLFAGKCTPQRPVGACMVSSEGACAAAYKYGGGI